MRETGKVQEKWPTLLLQVEVVQAVLAVIAQVAGVRLMPKHLVIATRGSALALWQSNFIKEQIERENPACSVSLNVIKTKGDLIQNRPLAEVGGKGLFVKEIEEALLDKRADLAVHSVKDVPMQLPEGLILGCIPKREDASDCFLSNKWHSLETLPQGATVGTSSLRRKAQLLNLRPDLKILPLRGNIDTRLAKLHAGECDAIILATAGLYRLGLTAPFMQPLPFSMLMPAAGQGALGLECREDDYDLLVLLSSLEDRMARVCVSAERSFLKTLNGSCQVPIAAHAQMPDEETVILQGLVATEDGEKIIKSSASKDASLAEELGVTLASSLLKKGADSIISEYASSR